MENNALEGVLGYKGERGYSAYEIAVKNGFVGTERDWLSTLGTSSHFSKEETIYVSGENQSSFDIPNNYTSNSFLDVYVEGERLNSNEYQINLDTRKILLNIPLEVEGTRVSVIVMSMSTNDLPISETINEDSTNDSAAGARAVYDFVGNSINDAKEEINNSLTNSEVDTDEIYADIFARMFTFEKATITGEDLNINTINVYHGILDGDEDKLNFANGYSRELSFYYNSDASLFDIDTNFTLKLSKAPYESRLCFQIYLDLDGIPDIIFENMSSIKNFNKKFMCELVVWQENSPGGGNFATISDFIINNAYIISIGRKELNIEIDVGIPKIIFNDLSSEEKKSILFKIKSLRGLCCNSLGNNLFSLGNEEQTKTDEYGVAILDEEEI